jgi:hypothetical protein
MTVMIEPTAMIRSAATRIVRLAVAPATTRPRLRMTSRISRGIRPTAAIPVPAVKPRPSDLARV